MSKQLNKWCKRILTTHLFYINKVEHPEWSGLSIRKHIVDSKKSYSFAHGHTSHILVII